MKKANTQAFKKSLAAITSLLLAGSISVFAACGGEQGNPGTDNPGITQPDDNLTIKSLIIDNPPAKTEYMVGEMFETTGMALKVEWSDGLKESVSVSSCTYSPDRPLTLDDKEVVITYATDDGTVSVKQPISVVSLDVTGIAVDTGNMSLKGAVNTPMDFSGIKVTATYEGGVTRELANGAYTVSADGKEVEDISEVVFEEAGEKQLTVTFEGKTATVAVEIINGYIIEAETAIPSSEVTEEHKNFAEKVNGAFIVITKPNEPASGGSYLGSVFKDNILRFHIWAEVDGYADIILRASSAYMTVDGGSWSPIEMGDQQFNRLFDIKYGSKSDADGNTLKPIYVEDDVILKGGKTDKPQGDPLLYVNWQDVKFGTIPVTAGDNIIEMTVITDYTNCKGETVACNIDRLEIQYTSDYAEPTTAKSIEITKAPDKTTYLVGDKFDATGMEIRAHMSDGTTKEISSEACAITPSGALTADDTKVTLSWRGVSVEQEIEVVTVKSLSITTAPAKTEYAAGQVFDTAGMAIKALLSNGSELEVDLADCAVTPAGALSVSDTKVTISYLGASVEQAITVKSPVAGQSFKIEGENLIKDPTADDRNYVEAVRNGYQGAVAGGNTEAPGVAETSGGRYLKGLFGANGDNGGAVVRFHINSDTAQRATVKIYVSSCNVVASGNGNPWNPSEMGSVQFNKVFAVKFGTADNLAAVNIGDDVIVEGGKTDDGSVNMALWENWREITLGTFDLVAGDNIIELENINSTLKNLAGEIFGFNLDCMVVEYV